MSTNNRTADAILRSFVSDDVPNGQLQPANVVDVLATVGQGVVTQLKYLGGGDNTDHRGAVEMLGVSVREAGERIAEGLESIASAIREGELAE